MEWFFRQAPILCMRDSACGKSARTFHMALAERPDVRLARSRLRLSLCASVISVAAIDLVP